jgi:hypothetical protein
MSCAIKAFRDKCTEYRKTCMGGECYECMLRFQRDVARADLDIERARRKSAEKLAGEMAECLESIHLDMTEAPSVLGMWGVHRDRYPEGT